jgi:hypothetical protein
MGATCGAVGDLYMLPAICVPADEFEKDIA